MAHPSVSRRTRCQMLQEGSLVSNSRDDSSRGGGSGGSRDCADSSFTREEMRFDERRRTCCAHRCHAALRRNPHAVAAVEVEARCRAPSRANVRCASGQRPLQMLPCVPNPAALNGTMHTGLPVGARSIRARHAHAGTTASVIHRVTGDVIPSPDSTDPAALANHAPDRSCRWRAVRACGPRGPQSAIRETGGP